MNGERKEGTASREGEAVILLDGLGRVGGQVAQEVFDNLTLLLFAHGRFHQSRGGADSQVGSGLANLGHGDALLGGDATETLFDGLLRLGFRFVHHLLTQMLSLDASLFDEVVGFTQCRVRIGSWRA